jgi:hypothetical protein
MPQNWAKQNDRFGQPNPPAQKILKRKILAKQTQPAKAQHCRLLKLANVAQMPRPRPARTS